MSSSFFVVACGIFSCGVWDLVPCQGLNLGPLHWEQSLGHWTTREVLPCFILNPVCLGTQLFSGTVSTGCSLSLAAHFMKPLSSSHSLLVTVCLSAICYHHQFLWKSSDTFPRTISLQPRPTHKTFMSLRCQMHPLHFFFWVFFPLKFQRLIFLQKFHHILVLNA